jgi:hypothetical protein
MVDRRWRFIGRNGVYGGPCTLSPSFLSVHGALGVPITLIALPLLCSHRSMFASGVLARWRSTVAPQ